MMNRLVKTTSRGLVRGVALGLGAFAGCGGVSGDPLATYSRDMGAGATSDGGSGSSSGPPTASGSGGVGGEFAPNGESGARAENTPLGGEGGFPSLPQGGAGEGGGPGDPPRWRRCSSAASFGAPKRVPGVPEGAVRLRLNPSETVGYYARLSGAGTSFDLEVATRETRTDAFSSGTPINTNDNGWDFSPTLTGDDTVLYFERRDENLVWRLHQSVWDTVLQAFGQVDLVPGIGLGTGNHSDGGPYVTPSGNALYFHSNRSGTAIYRAQRIGTSFGQVAKMSFTFPEGLALTPGCPVVSPDELTLYFAAHESAGPSDIWMAKRAKKGEPFGEAARVVELNTAGENEVPSFVSEDGCRLYFDRNSNVPFSWNSPPGNSFVAEREPDSE